MRKRGEGGVGKRGGEKGGGAIKGSSQVRGSRVAQAKYEYFDVI